MPPRPLSLKLKKSLQLKRKTGTRKLFTGTEKNESALEGQDKYEGGEEDVEVMRDNAM